MKNPAHPGEVLRELYLAELGITITNAAKMLGISRKSLSELVNAKAGVSPLVALRLSKAFPNTSPEFWLRMQNHYDLAREQGNPVLKKVQVLHRSMAELRYTG